MADPVRARDRALAALLALATAGYLLALPLNLNPTDESIILYGAKRVLQGQALYRDVFEFITPLSFYYFAGAFAVGGVTLVSARVALAVADAAAAAALFLLARRVAGIPEALVAVLLFVGGCLPVWHMASAHWLSTALCLATALALCGGAPHRAPRRAVVVGVLAGLDFCTQQHRGVLLGLWVVVGTVLLALADGPRAPRRLLAPLTWTGVGWLAAAVPVLGYALWRSSLPELLAGTVTFVFSSYAPDRTGQVAWNAPGLIHRMHGIVHPTWIGQALPVLLGAETVLLLAAVRRGPGAAVALRAALLLLAVLMALSILYYPDFIHVAFIAPFSLVVAAGMLHRLRTVRPTAPWRVPAVILHGGLLLAGFAAAGTHGVEAYRAAWDESPEHYTTAFGPLDSNSINRTTQQQLEALFADIPPEQRRLFAYPSSPWFYLTLPADNPTPFSLLLRRYSPPAHFARVLATLADDPPPFVIVNAVFMPADDPVQAFVRAHYTPMATVLPAYDVYRSAR